MSKNPIWMPLYIGDYLRDTRHLTTLQHGAYLLLIMEYWVKGKVPTSDTERRQVCLLTSRQWKKNKAAISAMFGQNWQHSRIDEELKKANELKLKRAVYGSIGGRISRGRSNSERFQVVNLNPTKSLTKSSS